MSDRPAGECQVYLFEGGRGDVQARVNEFLAAQKENPSVRLVDVVFNFQGQEYDGAKAVPESSSFGLGLVFQYVIPSVPPAYDSPLKRIIAGGNAATPVCALTPEMLFTIAGQSVAVATTPYTRIGRAWRRFATRFLLGPFMVRRIRRAS